MTMLQNIACVWVVLAQIAAQDTLRPLFAFTSSEAAQRWQAVNDGVMGGISDGRFRITEEQTLEFFDTLSLENNGGFASVRTKPTICSALRRFFIREPFPATVGA